MKSIKLIVFISIILSATVSAEQAADYRSPETLEALVMEAGKPYLLVDVRTPFEYESGFIPTAVNIPVQDLPAGLPEVPKDSLIILYCRSGNRSATAARIFREAGFSNVVDFGGVYRWPGELCQPQDEAIPSSSCHRA